MEPQDESDARAQEDRLAVLNLHDAFMNAQLPMTLMEDTPPPDIRPDHTLGDWTSSRRGRLERLWLTMLYVLIEAWQRNAGARSLVEARADTRKLRELIEHCRMQGIEAKLRDTRNYMCHRDRREYWNEGRFGFAGHYEACRELTGEFGRVLLAAARASRPGAE